MDSATRVVIRSERIKEHHFPAFIRSVLRNSIRTVEGAIRPISRIHPYAYIHACLESWFQENRGQPNTLLKGARVYPRCLLDAHCYLPARTCQGDFDDRVLVDSSPGE
jgi:hypothetical protein